jgi:hypothetical protein
VRSLKAISAITFWYWGGFGGQVEKGAYVLPNDLIVANSDGESMFQLLFRVNATTR